MITIYNSNLDFDLTSSNSITLSSTSNMIFKTNGSDKLTILNNGINVDGNVVVSGLISSSGAGFSGIGAGLSNIPISAINELRLELNGSTTDLSVTRDALTSRIVSEVGFGSNYTGRINSELNTRVDNTSNYVLATSNILIGRIINTSNYVDSTSNFLSGRIDNTSNYVLATSNILLGRIINTSNYVDSTSNFISVRIDNTSNYAMATSNILIGRIINTSNYVDSTSNILIGRIINTSNYVFATSNTLIGRIINASNYVESTSNILIGHIINTSNYIENTSNTLIGRIINTSNYIENTSNILIGRIINTSNYVSSYKPLTAVRADTADKFTTSRKIANVPFDGSSDISISYNNLDNKLNAATGINIDISNNISAVYASTNLIGIFNTTDFANVNSKIELTKNTSNYIDRINTSLTTAIALGDKWASSNANIYYNTSNVGIGTFNPVGNLHIYNDLNPPKIIIQDGKIGDNIGFPASIIPDGTAGTTTTTIGTTDKCTNFTNTGATQTTYTFTTTNAMLCDILIVGGGGGGGSRHAGGGGAGAVIYLTNQTLSAGSYSISVGNGGVGATTMGQGTKGGDSSVSLNSTTIYLARGGGAGHHDPSTGNSNKDGGSGGGSGQSTFGLAVLTNTPLGIYGNSGGISSGTSIVSGGGGGGASTSGSNSTSTNGGNGGNGTQLSITGTATYYGGGGGGGSQETATAAGNGGLGGGGPGSKGAATATNGTDGTGGGGGGGGFGGFNGVSNGNGGNGGSGIVIIRYKQLNLKPEIQFIIGTSISSGYNNYKIGNYNGEFQVKSSNSDIDTTAIRIINSGNVAIGTIDTATYKLNVGGSLNTTSLFVGGSAFTRDMTSNYSDIVGGWGSNYAYDKVGVWSSNYSDKVGGWGSNYAYDKVGVWGSNYSDRVGERTSNYVLATSNILIGRIINTSNYVSSYKPATAVRADTADKLTASKRIANVPFDGSADINISYNSLQDILTAGNGITILNNQISANAAPQEQSDWNITTQSSVSFIRNKPDLTIIATNNTNTSNYVLATSNLLANYNNLINKPFQFNGTDIFYNAGNVGIGTNIMNNILQIGNGGRLRISNNSSDMTIIGTNDIDGIYNTRISIFGNTYSGYSGNIQYIATSQGIHMFYTGGDTERMRITNTGNVAIGSLDTSTYKLNVGGTLNTTGLFVNGSALTTTIALKQDILTAANTIGVFNTTTDFVVNGSKIELTKNTSNYAESTSNILIGRIINTSNYIDRINTSLTTAIGLKQDILTAANTIGVFNTTTDFVVNGSKIELTKNTSNYVERVNTALTTAIAGKQNTLSAGSGITILGNQISANASAQVQTDWNAVSGLGVLLNKPTIPAAQVRSNWLETNGSSLSFIDNKPTIPAAQVQTDWNAVSGLGVLLNKPDQYWKFNGNNIYHDGNECVVIGADNLKFVYKLQLTNGTGCISLNNSSSGLGKDANFPCNKINLWNNQNGYYSYGFGISVNSVDYFTSLYHRFYTYTGGSDGKSVTAFGTEVVRMTDPSSGYPLEVLTPITSSITMTAAYFNTGGVVTNQNVGYANICAKFNGALWSTQYYAVSSDIRIKEDLQDINDDSALQSILAINPKTYKYIDKIERGDKRVYGFIAQQIKEIIPEAITIQKSYIPNIMLLADYYNNVITFPSRPTYIIKENDKIKCIDKNNKDILVVVVSIIDELTFLIKHIDDKDIYTDTKIFVYGIEVDDFHTLDKTYIFTLNVCATQELYRRMEVQNIIIKSQEDRIKVLETKVDMLLSRM